MRIISIVNQKGGVGKTTTTVNIGAGLALRGKRVLLIDYDPQADLSKSLGVHGATRDIYGCMRGLYPLSPVHVTGSLYAVPSTRELSGAEVELASKTGPERNSILRNLIDPLKDSFDYVLIDTSRSFGILSVNSFVASTEVFITMQSQILSIEGTVTMIDLIREMKPLNPGLDLSGIIITMYDGRTTLNRDVAELISEKFGRRVFKTRIRNNVSLAEAPSQKLDIFRYSPRSIGAEDYSSLCREIVEQESR